MLRRAAGICQSKGDVLMILMPTWFLPKIFRAWRSLRKRQGQFMTMEDEAMRFFNFLGNKFFSMAFSWLLGQPIKDTLCGTKVLRKSDYELVAANRNYFGDFDPFGDYDLIFGAAKLGLKIIDLPVRYRARTYGTTNIQRWSHGLLLLRMVMFAARKIKFT